MHADSVSSCYYGLPSIRECFLKKIVKREDEKHLNISEIASQTIEIVCLLLWHPEVNENGDRQLREDQ